MKGRKKCLGLEAFVLFEQRKIYLKRSERQRKETEFAGAVICKMENMTGSWWQMRTLCLGRGTTPLQGEFMLCFQEDGEGRELIL